MAYPNNPHHGVDGDTEDGLLANEAALAWVVENRATTWVVVHGTSAGSVGAFAKIGRFADFGPDGVFPERVIGDDDFRAVPILDIIGDRDQLCAGQWHRGRRRTA